MRKRYLGFSVFVIVILMLMTFAEAYQIADGNGNDVDDEKERLLANVNNVNDGSNVGNNEVKVNDNADNNKNRLLNNIVNDFKSWIGFFGSVLSYGRNKVSGNAVGGITGNAIAPGYNPKPYDFYFDDRMPGSRRPFPDALALGFYLSMTSNPVFWKWNLANPANLLDEEEAHLAKRPRVPATIISYDVKEISPEKYEYILANSEATGVGLPWNFYSKGLKNGIAYFDAESHQNRRILFEDHEKKLIETFLQYVLKRIEAMQANAQITLFAARAFRGYPLDFRDVPDEIRDPTKALPIVAWRQMVLDKMINNERVSEDAILNYGIPFKSINDLPVWNIYQEQVKDAINLKAMYLAIINELKKQKAMLESTLDGAPIMKDENIPYAVLADWTRSFLNPDNPRGPFKSVVPGYYISLSSVREFTIERYYEKEGRDRNLWRGWDFDLTKAKPTYEGVNEYLDANIKRYSNFVDWLDTAYPMLAIKDSNGNPLFNGNVGGVLETHEKLRQYYIELETQAIKDLKDSQKFIGHVFDSNPYTYEKSKDLINELAELIPRAPQLNLPDIPNYKVFASKTDSATSFIASIFSPLIGAGTHLAFTKEHVHYVSAIRMLRNYFSIVAEMNEFNIDAEKYSQIKTDVAKRIGTMIMLYFATLGAGYLLTAAKLVKNMATIYFMPATIRGVLNAETAGQLITTLSVLGYNLYMAKMIISDSSSLMHSCSGFGSGSAYDSVAQCANLAAAASMLVLTFYNGPGTERMIENIKETQRKLPGNRLSEEKIKKLVDTFDIVQSPKGKGHFIARRHPQVVDSDGNPVPVMMDPSTGEIIGGISLELPEEYISVFEKIIARSERKVKNARAILASEKGEMTGFPEGRDMKQLAKEASEGNAPAGSTPVSIINPNLPKRAEGSKAEGIINGLFDNLEGSARQEGVKILTGREVVDLFTNRVKTDMQKLQELAEMSRLEDRLVPKKFLEEMANPNRGYVHPTGNLPGIDEWFLNANPWLAGSGMIGDYIAEKYLKNALLFARAVRDPIYIDPIHISIPVYVGRGNLIPYMFSLLEGHESFMVLPDGGIPKDFFSTEEGKGLILITNSKGQRVGLSKFIGDSLTEADSNRVDDVIDNIILPAIDKEFVEETTRVRALNEKGIVGEAPMRQGLNFAERNVLIPMLEDLHKKGYLRAGKGNAHLKETDFLRGQLLLVNIEDIYDADLTAIVLLKYLTMKHKVAAGNARKVRAGESPIKLNLDGKEVEVYLDLQVSTYSFKALNKKKKSEAFCCVFVEDEKRIGLKANTPDDLKTWPPGKYAREGISAMSEGPEGLFASLVEDEDTGLVVLKDENGNPKVTTLIAGIRHIRKNKLAVVQMGMRSYTPERYTLNLLGREGQLSTTDWPGKILKGIPSAFRRQRWYYKDPTFDGKVPEKIPATYSNTYLRDMLNIYLMKIINEANKMGKIAQDQINKDTKIIKDPYSIDPKRGER